MTDQDLNKLVKLWLNGFSKLEYVRISVNGSINFQEVMMDIRKVPVRSARIQNELQYFYQGDAYKIRQGSGKEAVVCILSRKEFVISTYFDDKSFDFWSEYGSSDEEGIEEMEENDF